MLDPERHPLATTNALTIPSRFNGPAGIGNGGYVCGRIAAYIDGRATVTLRRPPPLDTPMEVERDGEGSVRVRHGRTLIGEAAPSPAGPLEIPATVSPAQADAAARGARYFTDPVFPDCFVCGMNRRPGDGLRIFPGPVTGLALWAAPWIPDPSVAGPDGRVPAGGGLGRARLSQRDRRRRGGRPGRRVRLGHRHPARPDDGHHPGGAARGRRPVPGDRLAGTA